MTAPSPRARELAAQLVGPPHRGRLSFGRVTFTGIAPGDVLPGDLFDAVAAAVQAGLDAQPPAPTADLSRAARLEIAGLLARYAERIGRVCGESQDARTWAEKLKEVP